jgi:hypothetical protein
MPEVPRDPSALNATWFRDVLSKHHPQVEVTAVRLEEDLTGTSSKLFYAVDYAPGSADDLPRQLLVKGGFADHSDAFLAMHRTEMLFYRDVAPGAAFDTPRCFAAIEDAASGRCAVLLEDLRQRPVRWLDPLDPLGWRDVTAFVDALAALAAQHWESPAFGPGGQLAWVIDSYSADAKAYIDHYLEPARWAEFMRRPRCAALPRRLRDRGRMVQALEDLALRLTVQPLTLSHGDTHLGNLYVNADGTPGFLDAQPRRAPWVKDLAYHIVSALDVEDRRAWERPLLARYLRRLAQHGVSDAPSFEEAWADFRAELDYGLFIFMINESHFQREEVNTAYASRFAAAILDHS